MSVCVILPVPGAKKERPPQVDPERLIGHVLRRPGTVLLFFAFNVPLETKGVFLLPSATVLFIPFSSPKILSTLNDISLPEVGSTAVVTRCFIESAGAAYPVPRHRSITPTASDTRRQSEDIWWVQEGQVQTIPRLPDSGRHYTMQVDSAART